MEKICKNCANGKKVVPPAKVVICSITGLPKRYDNNAERCIGFKPKEKPNE